MKNYLLKKIFFVLMLGSLSITSFSQPTGIPCNPNTFWAMQGPAVEEYTLNNNVVTFIGNVWSGTSIDPNLAWCTNLDGGSFSPTFYTTFNYQQPRYFDGTNWITATASVAPDKIFNPGSNGTHLYYMLVDSGGGSYFKEIVRYDGNVFTSVFSWDTTRKAVVADVAVDSLGNVFVCMGNNDNLNMTDTIMLVSPAGQIVQKYPFAFDTYNSYGCFLLNNILYIGIGNSNTTNPNTLIPVSFSGSTATAGTPIPHSPAADLASCNANLQLSVDDLVSESSFNIFPNPADQSLVISHQSSGNGNYDVKIYDVMGKEIFQTKIAQPTSNLKLQTSNFSNGIYFIQLSSENKTATQKLIVQH